MVRKLLFLCVLISGVASAQTRVYVDDSATGNNDGTSWQNAYTDLNSALINAVANQIWIAGGVYRPHASNRNASFQLNHSVQLYGGFAGNETELTDRDFALIHTDNATFFSGDLAMNDAGQLNFTNSTRSENSFRVVNVDGANVEIDGVIISGGNANATSGNSRFGAALSINNNVENFTIRNSIIRFNTAVVAAGLNLRAANGDTINCTVQGCTFQSNLTSNVAAGIYVLPEQGTAINFVLTNCIFNGNLTANNGAGLGHGLSAVWARSLNSGNFIRTTIVNNTFANNLNTGTGVSDFATVGLSRSAGAAHAVERIANNIFWGNRDNNLLVSRAFGKRTDDSFPTNFAVSNSIDEDNFSNVGSTAATSNNDPLFNGQFSGDFTLTASSPAIDAGFNAGLPQGVITDIANKVRIHNTIIDMGAHEFGAAAYVPAALTINVIGNGSVTPNDTVYNTGEVATLTATPDAGWQFDGWSGDTTTTTNPLQLTMDSNTTVTAQFSPTVSISEQASQINFSLYPNPADTHVFINYDGVVSSIAIYNAIGKKLKPISQETDRVDISSLASGVYFIAIETDRGAAIHKFIKK